MSLAKTSSRRNRHVTAAVVFALLSTALLVAIISREGVHGITLWIITGHQCVAQAIVIAWVWILSGDDEEMPS